MGVLNELLINRWTGMLIRSAVAAMDFNENVDRKSKVDADGNTRYKMKVWYLFSYHHSLFKLIKEKQSWRQSYCGRAENA